MSSVSSAKAVRAVQPWLVRQKVMLPSPVGGYVDRPFLVRQSDPMRRRLTVIHAPGGYGKTTLLAAACRRRREAGDIVAWLTLDEGDNDHKTLATYLDFAFAAAGLETEASLGDDPQVAYDDDRVNALMAGIANRGPCALALDEVQLLNAPESIAVVNHLIRYGPPNLHLALACREVPEGVDAAAPIFEGRGLAINTAQLRFGKPEIARFYDDALAPAEIAELEDASQGWPIALCIHRNTYKERASFSKARQLAANWIEARLWSGMSPGAREFVLDIGLFDWLETSIVDGVLGPGSMRRLRATRALAGLAQPAGGDDGDVMVLHPLVKQYCMEHRRRTSPERFRAIHRAIAKALAHDGKIIVAMRHASEAGDHRLIGAILEGAGAALYWLRNGLTMLEAANELATPEARAMFPRVALMHCMALFVFGSHEPALQAYAELHTRTEGLTADRDGGNDKDLNVERVVFEYLAAWVGCRPIGTPEMDALMSAIARIAQDDDVDPFVRGLAEHALGSLESAKGNLDAAMSWLERARPEFARSSPYMMMYVDLQIGFVAMCQGRVADAAAAIRLAREAAARNEYRRDAGVSLVGEIAAIELESERTGFVVPGSRVPATLAEYGSNAAALHAFAAGVEFAAESALRDGDPDRSANTLEEAARFAHATGRATLGRCVAGQRVSLLAATGSTEEAQRLWTESGLPEQARDIVDLKGQTWREMEAIACAAIELRTAQSDFDAAREIVDATLAVCAEQGLKRTLMRSLALAMVAEHRAGNAPGAKARLAEYIELYAETDYARPLLRKREVALEVLRSMDRADVDQRLHNVMAALAGILEDRPAADESAAGEADAAPELTARERQVVARLEDLPDKRIASMLNLSHDGVRYHVRNIFRKLGVSDRHDAVRRARALGILDD